MFKKIVFLLALFAVTSFAQGNLSPLFGEIKYNNFIDDTINLTYTNGTSDTSVVVGFSKGRFKGVSQGLYCTMFYKVTPDSVDSLGDADVNLILEEFDYCPMTGDSVFTLEADGDVDTLSPTGIAGDTSWTKVDFSPRPSNGFRVRAMAVAATGGCNYTAKIWFHIRSKWGM